MNISPRIKIQIVLLLTALICLFGFSYLYMPEHRIVTGPLFFGGGIILFIYHIFLVQWYRAFLEIREKKRVAERLAYAGTMAGALAHEIRSPLSTIVLNLQLIEEDFKDKPLSSEDARMLKKNSLLQKEAKRLEEILDTFLGIARGEKLQLKEVHLNNLLEEILSLHIPEMEKKNIRVLKHLDEVNPLCNIDRNLIKEAITNILVNARQAMDAVGGELIIKTYIDRKGVYIDIIDTGPGMPGEIKNRIFNLYFTTKQGGSGVGLARSKKIIEQHHGGLTVESQVGKGTSVTIFLPFEKN